MPTTPPLLLALLSQRIEGIERYWMCQFFNLCSAVLSMPDTVEEMCPEIPRLDKLLKDVNDVSESGARYSDMPQVTRLKHYQ